MIDFKEFKERFDLVEYVTSTRPTKRTGRGVLARCIVHEDSEPSMLVSRKFWHCFSCHEQGDAIRFLSIDKGISEYDAVISASDTSFCKEYKIEAKVKEVEYKRPDVSNVSLHKKTLLASPAKLEYLLSRGLSMESIDRFHLGYGKPTDHWFKYPRYTIPIFDKDDALITIRYRVDGVLEDKPKYMTHPGTESFLFNVGAARNNKNVVLTGSQIDAILLEQYGIPAVGSAGEGVFKVGWEKYFDGVNLYVLFDNDSAGVRGTKHVCSMVETAIPVYWPSSFPEKYDINDALLDPEVGINGIRGILNGVARSGRMAERVRAA